MTESSFGVPPITGSGCNKTCSDRPLVAGFLTVALVALHRLYQRNCKDCGYHWTVTRAQKQKTVRLLNPRSHLLQTGETFVQGQKVEPFRESAKCGGIRFSERPVTKRRPADPPV